MAPIVGYRFRPNDQELVGHHLKEKNLGNYSELVGPIIELDVYDCEPWEFSDGRDYFYIFTMLPKRNPRSNLIKRTTKAGSWKITGRDREIKDGGRTIGMKKILVYHSGHGSEAQRTAWVMQELRSNLSQNYVVCKIKKKENRPSVTTLPDASTSLAPGDENPVFVESVEEADLQTRETAPPVDHSAMPADFCISGLNDEQDGYNEVQELITSFHELDYNGPGPLFSEGIGVHINPNNHTTLKSMSAAYYESDEENLSDSSDDEQNDLEELSNSDDWSTGKNVCFSYVIGDKRLKTSEADSGDIAASEEFHFYQPRTKMKEAVESETAVGLIEDSCYEVSENEGKNTDEQKNLALEHRKGLRGSYETERRKFTLWAWLLIAVGSILVVCFTVPNFHASETSMLEANRTRLFLAPCGDGCNTSVLPRT